MRVDDFEIRTGEVAGRVYREVQYVEVQLGARFAFAKAPTIEEANAKLREKAVELGANGLIRVAYHRGVTRKAAR
jgi:hypothetical protein